MNIQILLKELNKTMSDAEIGIAVGASQSTITRLRNGTHRSTLFEKADAIRKLAREKGITEVA